MKEKEECPYCLGDGYVIRDWSDPSGEHMQTELPCQCQVPFNEEEDLYDYTA